MSHSLSEMPLRPLTIYCLDHRVTSLTHARHVIKEGAGDPQELVLDEKSRAWMFIPEAKEKPPSWRALFQGYVAAPQFQALMNRSSRALILIETEGHVFAVTFGHSKHLLDYGYVRRAFGLRVVVNSVPPDKLHSIDMRQFEKLSMHTRRHTASEEHLQSFGLDWTQDILRAVAGVPRDPSFARRAAGADALVITTRYTLSDLPKICVKAIEYHGDSYYKKTPFSYIDWFQPETDLETIEELDLSLCSTLLLGPTLGSPLPVLESDDLSDLDNIIRISFAEPGGRTHYSEPDVDKFRVYLQQKTDSPAGCLKLVRRGRVEITSGERDEFEQSSSLYEALTWEHSLDLQDYILLGGTWIRISKDHAERVKDYIKSEIGAPTHPLPSSSQKWKEDDYIQEVCEGDLEMLSLQGLTHKGESMNHPIELCDILSVNRVFYCIKTGNKSKVLNHLFRQGHGAGVTLVSDRSYLTGCSELIFKAAQRANRTELSADYQAIMPAGALNAPDYEFCFCILKPKTKRWPLCIPYLAQLTLHETARRLKAAGFRVSIQCIDVPRAAPKRLASAPIRRVATTPNIP